MLLRNSRPGNDKDRANQCGFSHALPPSLGEWDYSTPGAVNSRRTRNELSPPDRHYSLNIYSRTNLVGLLRIDEQAAGNPVDQVAFVRNVVPVVTRSLRRHERAVSAERQG
jgi:hypothetical protein